MDANHFFLKLIKEFPALEKEVCEEDPAMVHRRMEIFAAYTVQQIKDNQVQELAKCFRFQESAVDQMDADLKNALYVSYCETLLLGEVSGKMDLVLPFMGDKLRAVYLDYEKHYRKMVKKSNSAPGPPGLTND